MQPFVVVACLSLNCAAHLLHDRTWTGLLVTFMTLVHMLVNPAIVPNTWVLPMLSYIVYIVVNRIRLSTPFRTFVFIVIVCNFVLAGFRLPFYQTFRDNVFSPWVYIAYQVALLSVLPR